MNKEIATIAFHLWLLILFLQYSTVSNFLIF